jgi:hypothetical protein
MREEYVQFCRKVKQEIKNAVVKFENDIAEKAKRDPKLVYAYVRSKQTV